MSATAAYPHSGRCARCMRERDDLFWHAGDEAFYCADVFRCEARYILQGEREPAALSEREPQPLSVTPHAATVRSEHGSAAPSRSERAAELTRDEERALLGLWLSRVMFSPFLDPALAPRFAETRTFEQFRVDHAEAAP